MRRLLVAMFLYLGGWTFPNSIWWRRARLIVLCLGTVVLVLKLRKWAAHTLASLGAVNVTEMGLGPTLTAVNTSVSLKTIGSMALGGITQNSGWPWPRNVYFSGPPEMGGLPEARRVSDFLG